MFSQSLHHDALVISLTVANCLVRRILVDNGSSSNIFFQAAYWDLGLEEGALNRKVTPLIGFSGEVNQTIGEIILYVYAKGINMDNLILGRPRIQSMGDVPSTLHPMVPYSLGHKSDQMRLGKLQVLL